MKTKSILLLILIVASRAAIAQIMFQRHYGGTEDDGGNSVIQTSDGGYLVAGSTVSYGAGVRDIYLIKTNEFGDTLWTKVFGGNDWDAAYSIKPTYNDNFIITGETSSFGAGASDVFLMRTDINGDSLWFKTYGGNEDDGGNELDTCSDGGFIITGYTCSFANEFSSVYLIRTNNNGDTLWTRTYEKDFSDGGYSVVQTSDGGFFISGLTSTSSNVNDCYIIKTDVNGDTLWTKTIGGTANDWSVSSQETSDNSFIITGATKSFGAGGFDVYVLKINSSGDVIWSNTIGGINDDSGSMVIPTSDNGFAIAGLTGSFGAGGDDVYLIKINQNGDTLWTRTFGGTGDDWATSIQETTDGGFILSGYTNSFGGNYDIYLIKTNSSGIAGFQQIIRLKTDCVIFPNPCDGILNIQMNFFTDRKVQIEIYNMNGQRVTRQIVENDNSGLFLLDLFPYPEGLYFLKIDSENQSFIKKVFVY